MPFETRAKTPSAGAGLRTLPPLDRVNALATLIEAEAVADEQATQVATAVVDALHAAGLLALMVPRELGGEEADPATLIDVIRALAYHDGSTGWYAGAVMTAGAVSGAMLGPKAIAAIYRPGARAICAGQAAPTGRAERAGPAAWRVSGKFAFASGCPEAEWLVGGYVVHENGQPLPGPHGAPTMLIGFTPRDAATYRGNWNVLGLRGTGSYDFEVAEQTLPADFFFEPGITPPRRGGALYRMGFMALPCLTHAAFALGCACRALDEWRDFAETKPRAPGVMANAMPTTQRDLAIAHAELRAAEAYVRRTFDHLYAAAQSGGPIDDDLRLDGRLCASNALATGTRVAQQAYAACTTTALRNGNAIQRAFRDMLAGNAHFLTGEGSWIDAGKVIAHAPGAALVF